MRVSCDSIVALGPRTRHGRPIFAKNSDRPAGECQPLLQRASADHPLGAKLRCQYIEIDQVRHTHAFVGSRPHWLWGVEHGINEHGVAIGNHTIFTKDPVAERGLLGMDLVRLGLERATTAPEAVQVLIELIERYGQGGSGYADTIWPYHNSFLVADGCKGLLLEASARYWALREIDGAASASNHVTIGRDWTRLSEGCEAHAREAGWWNGHDRFDFAAAYRDSSIVPPIVSSARHARTCAVLEEPGARLAVGAIKRLMRDHNESGELHRPGLAVDDERYYSVCMHADPVGTTTASMIVELGEVTTVPRLVWVAFCNPCVSPYLPVFLEGEVPEELQRGGAEPSSGGAWWRFKSLLSIVERDWERSAPLVRDTWRTLEEKLGASADELLADEAVVDPALGPRALTRFMRDAWEETLARLDALSGKLETTSRSRA